jgi:hypothetical protein
VKHKDKRARQWRLLRECMLLLSFLLMVHDARAGTHETATATCQRKKQPRDRLALERKQWRNPPKKESHR